jgi:transcriptional regulator with XRE-family HTH domain
MMLLESQDPFLLGRRLRNALREARTRSGQTQRQVAAELGWAASKLVRIEVGESSVSTNDLRALLRLYGIADSDTVTELIGMARVSRGQSWSSYRDIYSREFLAYLSYEGSAAHRRSFESRTIPGLLQTREYALAVSSAFLMTPVSQEVIEARIEARLRRQEILERADAPLFHFILDESVLRRRVGAGTDLMKHQLERLIQAARGPKVILQILPLAAGEHSGLFGTFVCLEPREAGDGHLVFLERGGGDLLLRDSPLEVQRFMTFFMRLEEIALSSAESVSFIQDVLRDMYGAGS